MRKLLASTAMALLLAGPVAAASDNAMGPFFDMSTAANGYYGSDLIGARLYTSETTVAANTTEQNRTEWKDIGEISDLLISNGGVVEAVILDIGGFLGIGEKTVAIDMSELHTVTDSSNPDERFFVVTSSQEMLENAPTFERADHGMMDSVSNTAENTMNSAQESVTGMWARPDIKREGYEPVDTAMLTADNLEGATVYGPNGESVGEISNLILTDDGKVSKAIVDVGGFLGLGEHRIAIAFDELQVLHESGGDDLSVHVNATQEELESRPAYEG